MKSEIKEKSKKVKNNRWQLINLMSLYRYKEEQTQNTNK